MIYFYITGKYSEVNSTMLYYAVCIDNETNKRSHMEGKEIGAKIECEANILGKVLMYGHTNNANLTINSDFRDMTKYANGEWKSGLKRVREFLNYLKKCRQFNQVEFGTDIPDVYREHLDHGLEYARAKFEQEGVTEQKATESFKKPAQPVGWSRVPQNTETEQPKSGWGQAKPKSNWGQAKPQTAKGWGQPVQNSSQTQTRASWKQPAPQPVQKELFSVAIYKPDGTELVRIDQDLCGKGGKKDATFFADWYEKESRDPNSQFFGVIVERDNVPSNLPKEEPKKEEPSQPEYRQINFSDIDK